MTQSLTTNTENIDQEEVDEFPVSEVRLIYYGVITSATTEAYRNHESSLVLLKNNSVIAFPPLTCMMHRLPQNCNHVISAILCHALYETCLARRYGFTATQIYYCDIDEIKSC